MKRIQIWLVVSAILISQSPAARADRSVGLASAVTATPEWVHDEARRTLTTLRTPYVVADTSVLDEEEKAASPAERTKIEALKDAMKGSGYFLGTMVAMAEVRLLVRLSAGPSSQNLVSWETAKEAGQVAADTVAGLSQWGNFLTTQAVGKVTYGPLAKLVAEDDPFIKKLLGQILSKSITTPVMFVVGNTFKSLVERSVSRLDPADRERGQNLIYATLNMRNRNYAADAKVFVKIMAGIGEIAVVNSDERNRWIYDYYRNDLMDGKTIVPFATGTLGGELGAATGSIFPVVGTTVGGLAGSLVGYTAGYFVPDERKDEVTEKTRSLRKSAVLARVDECMKLNEDTHDFAGLGFTRLPEEIQVRHFEATFASCEKIRNDYMTILFDGLRASYQKLVIESGRAMAAMNMNDMQLAREQNEKYVSDNFLFRQTLGDLLKFYPAQEARFRRIQQDAKLPHYAKVAEQESQRLRKVGAYLEEKLYGLTLIKVDPDAETFMTETSIGAFNEAAILASADQTHRLVSEPPLKDKDDGKPVRKVLATR